MIGVRLVVLFLCFSIESLKSANRRREFGTCNSFLNRNRWPVRVNEQWTNEVLRKYSINERAIIFVRQYFF